MKQLLFKIATRVVAWLDPRLDRFRPPKQQAPPFSPKTERELIEVLARTSTAVLPDEKRQKIAGAMTLESTPVKKRMIPLADLEVLTPDQQLDAKQLDRLSRSEVDFTPIIDKAGRCLGLFSLAEVDALSLAETSPLSIDYCDRNLCFLRLDYSLSLAINAMIRANRVAAVVVNSKTEIVGLTTIDLLLADFLDNNDDFTRDYSAEEVAARKIKR